MNVYHIIIILLLLLWNIWMVQMQDRSIPRRPPRRFYIDIEEM